MKKALLFIALLISGLGLNAQGVSKEKQNKNVLIEMFTDKGDSYGPTCHKIINQIIANNPGNVFTVNMHVNLFSSTNYPNINLDINREYMYGLNAQSIPSSHVNRSTNNTIDPRTDTNTVNQQLDQTAEVNIDGWVTIDDPSSRIATITVEAYYTADSKYNTNYLTIMMLQDSIIGSQSGTYANQEQMIGDQYCHMHVLRDVITDTWGDEITTTTAGSLVTKQYVYEIPEVIGDPNGIEVDLDNIRFIAFITETKYQILNVCEIHPAYSINYDGYSLSYRKASDEKCTVVGITHPASKMAITIPSSETINGTICSVTSIGNNTFKNCSNLTSIDIPESVTSIGESAFEGCSSLVSLEIPSSVTSIENNTFKNCSSLTSIDIPESVTSIGESAFEGCSSLKSITSFAKKVPTTADNAFDNCPEDMIIYVPEISLNAYKINYPWYLYKILAIGDNEEEPEEPGESIEELSSSINVYPNPVNNIIYIETEFKVEEVIVNDVYGRRQDTESPSHQTIDVSNLTSGVYFMKVATSEGEVVKRILKK